MPTNYKPSRKLNEDRDGLSMQEVINLAKAKNGWSGERLAAQLKISNNTLRQYAFRGVRSGLLIPKLLELTQLAGLSDAQGIVVILRHFVPEELAHLKPYVGCTVRRYRFGKRKTSKRVRRAPELFKRTVEAIPRAKD